MFLSAANCWKVGGIRLAAQPGTGRGDTFHLRTGKEKGGRKKIIKKKLASSPTTNACHAAGDTFDCNFYVIFPPVESTVEAVMKVDVRGKGLLKDALRPGPLSLSEDQGNPPFFISRCTILLPTLSCFSISWA